MICLWDVRHARNLFTVPDPGPLKRKRVTGGWTAFLRRGRHSSPIYSLQLDHSRIFVALADQTWTLDFGGKTSESRRIEKLRYNQERIGERRGIGRNRNIGERKNVKGAKESILFCSNDNWNELYEV
jgi:hypothetical protein